MSICGFQNVSVSLPREAQPQVSMVDDDCAEEMSNYHDQRGV